MSTENLKISLQAARVNAGFTQKEAAEALGIPASTLGGWEKNSTKLSYIEAHRLAKLYGISPDLLFFGTKNELIRYLKSQSKKVKEK